MWAVLKFQSSLNVLATARLPHKITKFGFKVEPSHFYVQKADKYYTDLRILIAHDRMSLW